MNQLVLATLVFATLALGEVETNGLVNTEAGTFRCHGSIVRLDHQGIPSSGDLSSSEMKPCDPVVEVRDTI